jgi:hypothetical protein
MVIALVERGQVRELQRLHDAAGVTAASDEVAAGHHLVRQIATSGTPVPPAPQHARVASRDRSGPDYYSGTSRRPPAVTREGFSGGAAQPGSRPQRAHRPRNANRAA